MGSTIMTHASDGIELRRPPLRLWPGIVIVALQWLLFAILPRLLPSAGAVAAIAALVGGLLVFVWWVFFSRATWLERLLAILVMVVAPVAVRPLLHESIATAGLGVLYFVYVVPWLSLALVAWAAATRHLAGRPRRVTMVVAMFLASGVWTLLRTSGVSGSGNEFAWRWSETPEEKLLARGAEEPDVPADEGIAIEGIESAAAWPGFRGPHRDSVVEGVRIATDWTATPPTELWRRPVGPGWSSFAVRGDRLYTQEQRGEEELVSCYDLSTGEPVWMHRDPVRFWESNAGAGPRATPTLRGNHVYVLGATGILNALDAGDGTVLWSRDIVADTGKEIPYWGFAASPWVLDDVVIVAAAGQLVAYDRGTSEPRWTGPDGGDGYSSPHLLTLDGVEQVVLLSAFGATSLDPADGTPLWQHEWPNCQITQPALTGDGDLLISALSPTAGLGIRRLSVTSGAGGWDVEERWTSKDLKPYFNDYVVHDGHAYGFDGTILASIDLTSGERNWKGGRYGQGQLLLLADQGLLLVITEQGELALVAAAPDRFDELARFPALDGKTWNHPVVVDDVLLVRNGQEMAAYRLSIETVVETTEVRFVARSRAATPNT
jgi:outer membrane protein assembly factor BamB